MENNRFIISSSVYLLIGGLILIFPFFSKAYYPETTHKGLTKNIILFFNKSYPDLAIQNQDDVDSIKKGSIDEDNPSLRALNHFYDPINNRGLAVERKAGDSSLASAGSTGLKLQLESSKDWAQDTKAQTGVTGMFAGTLTSYFASNSDYSWERGVYEYAWGDKKRGLESLGHVLHLIEDAGVPDHTRNDMHAGHNLPFGLTGISPYEDWTNQYFNESTIKVSEELKKENVSPLVCSSISICFDSIARYSNQNFFSKDTIFSEDYRYPVVFETGFETLGDGKKYEFGYGMLGGKKYKLLFFGERYLGVDKKEQSIEDRDKLILSDYWNLLSKQAVLHGAGVVKLFFDEVKKEKQTKTLYNKNRSWVGRGIDGVKNMAFGAASIFYGSSVTQNDINDDASQPSVSPSSQPSPSNVASITPVPSRSPAPTPLSIKLPSPSSIPQIILQPTPRPSPSLLSFVSRIFESSGGGEGSGSSQSSGGGSSSVQATPSPSASSSVSNSPTPSPSASPSVSVSASPWPTTSPSPLSTITPSPIPAADTQAPTLSFSVSECSKSLNSNICLVATTTVTLLWSSPDTDLAHYFVTCTANGSPCANFSFASTTATSTIYTVPADMTAYIFTARAVDTSNNESNAQTVSVDVWLRPVVINEIAWAGTGSSSTTDKDEWVELYNPTSKVISLSGMVLNSPTNNSFKMNLSGSIAAHDYYLIERTDDDDAVKDITADMTSVFGSGLSNDGEQLAIMIGSTTIDKTPAVGSGGCTNWCAGTASSQYLTMERYDPLSSGENKSNWGSWQDIVRYGTNADSQQIKGTPKHRNSINYLIASPSSNDVVQADKTITKANSPYVVRLHTAIAASAALTVEPGVVIKFKGASADLSVSGVLLAQGTASDPIVFTSFADDSYAGDTNQDAATSSPAAGDWGSVKILKAGSVIDHVIIRYGGGDSQKANISVKNTSADVTNSTIEYSKYYGIYFENANGAISGNVIRNNIVQGGESMGAFILGGTVSIHDNSFMGNYTGLDLNSGNFDVSHNVFTGNTGEAIFTKSSYPLFSGNSATGNGMNGIRFESPANDDYVMQADIPYVISQGGSFTVPARKTLTIQPGVVMKFQGGAMMDIAGTLQAKGTLEQPIIFTSFSDDDCGITGGCGDTNHASSTPQAGDWFSIKFESSAGSSALEYAAIRYGGKSNYPQDPGAVHVNSAASVKFSHVTLEKNYYAGMWIEHAMPQISDSFIQDNKGASSSEQYYGLFLVSSSTPAISHTHFKNNDVHIRNDSTSSYTDAGGNVFE